MLEYDFGPSHPFRPERLSACVELLARFEVASIDPGPATLGDALLVHSPELLSALKRAESYAEGHGLLDADEDLLESHGLLLSDNPPFRGMFLATLNFIGGTVRAASLVRDGVPLALTLAGGLHHCSRDRAQGFCLLNDPAIACAILRERFDRVAYIDLDLHHGDGVQSIWYEDPSVLTCSIHESGLSLYPGTGFSHETGAHFTALNMPLDAHTTGDVWLNAFRRGILPAIEIFQPEAIVLQMGADPHFSDPLGHLDVAAQDWLESVREVKRLNLPTVACGGGGYNMTSVIRMWTAAALTLMDVEFVDLIPEDLAVRWQIQTFSDTVRPEGRGVEAAERAIDYIRDHHLKGLPRL